MSSTATLTQQDTITTCLGQALNEPDITSNSLPVSPDPSENRTLKRSSTINESEKDMQTEKTQKYEENPPQRRHSNFSTTTLTNVRVSPSPRSKSDPVQYIFNIKHHQILFMHKSLFIITQIRALLEQ